MLRILAPTNNPPSESQTDPRNSHVSSINSIPFLKFSKSRSRPSCRLCDRAPSRSHSPSKVNNTASNHQTHVPPRALLPTTTTTTTNFHFDHSHSRVAILLRPHSDKQFFFQKQTTIYQKCLRKRPPSVPPRAEPRRRRRVRCRDYFASAVVVLVVVLTFFRSQRT